MRIHPVLERILSNNYLLLAGWLLMAFVVTDHRIDHGAFNNFLLFKYSYFHAADGLNLYNDYPECCFDSHHYGPLFSLLIAPFALLPLHLGLYVWQLFIVLLLFFAIRKLPISPVQRTLVGLICTQELYVSLREFQTNAGIAALIIFSWVLIENKKEFWAALVILIGFYVKLYGIVGLGFFFFSTNKKLFIQSLAFWAIVLFAAPMVLFSPSYIVQSYGDWFNILVYKNSTNVTITNQFQDVSVMGMTRKLLEKPGLPTLPFLLGGLIILLLPYLRYQRFCELRFRLNMLSAILLFTILFSTGSELATYIVAFTGVGIWFASGEWPKNRWTWIFLVLVLYFGSLFDSDLSTYHFRAKIIKPYALKALPCLLVWLAIIVEMVQPPRVGIAPIKTKIRKSEASHPTKLYYEG